MYKEDRIGRQKYDPWRTSCNYVIFSKL